MDRNDPPKLILNGTHKTEPPPPLRPEVTAELDALLKLTNEAGQSVYVNPAHILAVGPTNDLRLAAILMAYGTSLPTPHKPEAIAAEWARAKAAARALREAPIRAIGKRADELTTPPPSADFLSSLNSPPPTA